MYFNGGTPKIALLEQWLSLFRFSVVLIEYLKKAIKRMSGSWENEKCRGNSSRKKAPVILA